MSGSKYQIYLEIPTANVKDIIAPSDSDVAVAQYLREHGHVVEWFSEYENSLFIDGVEIQIDNFFYLYNDKVYGKLKDIEEALSYVNTQTASVNDGLVNVIQYFKNKGYLVEMISEIPKYIFVNGISFYVGMFVSRKGTPVLEPRSLEQNVYEYYAPDSFLYELEAQIPDTFDDTLSKYSGKELKKKIKQYNEPIVEVHYANSDESLNRLITKFNAYIKEDNPNINFVIERVNS